jgi:hypothetical protein
MNRNLERPASEELTETQKKVLEENDPEKKLAQLEQELKQMQEERKQQKNQ